MKQFFIDTYDTGMKIFGVFCLVVSIIWSWAWSVQDGALNLQPCFFIVFFIAVNIAVFIKWLIQQHRKGGEQHV